MTAKKIVFCDINALFNQDEVCNNNLIEAIRSFSSLIDIDVYLFANISMTEIHDRVIEASNRGKLLLGEKIKRLEDNGVSIKAVVTYADMYYFDENGEIKAPGSIYIDLYKPNFLRFQQNTFEAFQFKGKAIIPFDDEFFQDLAIYERAINIFKESAQNVEPGQVFSQLCMKSYQAYDIMRRTPISSPVLTKPVRDLPEDEREQCLSRYKISKCDIEVTLRREVPGHKGRYKKLKSLVMEHCIEFFAGAEKITLFCIDSTREEVEEKQEVISSSAYRRDIYFNKLYIEGNNKKEITDYFYFFMKNIPVIKRNKNNAGETCQLFSPLGGGEKIKQFDHIARKIKKIFNEFNQFYLSKQDADHLKNILYHMAEQGHIESLLLLAKFIIEGISPFSYRVDEANAYCVLRIALFAAATPKDKFAILSSLELMLLNYNITELLDQANQSIINEDIDFFAKKEFYSLYEILEKSANHDVKYLMYILKTREINYLRNKIKLGRGTDENAKKSYQKTCEQLSIRLVQKNNDTNTALDFDKAFTNNFLVNTATSHQKIALDSDKAFIDNFLIDTTTSHQKTVVLVNLDACLIKVGNRKKICRKLIHDLKVQGIDLIYLFADLSLKNIDRKINSSIETSCLDLIRMLDERFQIRVAEVITLNDKEKQPGEWFRNTYCPYYRRFILGNKNSNGYVAEINLDDLDAVNEPFKDTTELLHFVCEKIVAKKYKIIEVESDYLYLDSLARDDIEIIIAPGSNEKKNFDHINQEHNRFFPFLETVNNKQEDKIQKIVKNTIKLLSQVLSTAREKKKIKEHINDIVNYSEESVEALLFLADYAKKGDKALGFAFGLYKKPNIAESYFLLKLALLASGTNKKRHDKVLAKLIEIENQYWYVDTDNPQDFWHNVQLYENGPSFVLPKTFLYRGRGDDYCLESSNLRIHGYSVFELFFVWENSLKLSYPTEKISCYIRNGQLSNLFYYYERMIGKNLLKLRLFEKDQSIIYPFFQHVDQLANILKEKQPQAARFAQYISKEVMNIMQQSYILDHFGSEKEASVRLLQREPHDFIDHPMVTVSDNKEENLSATSDGATVLQIQREPHDFIDHATTVVIDEEEENLIVSDYSKLFNLVTSAEKLAAKYKHDGKQQLFHENLSKGYLLLIKAYLVSSSEQLAIIAWDKLTKFQEKNPTVVYHVFSNIHFNSPSPNSMTKNAKKNLSIFANLTAGLYQVYKEQEKIDNNLAVKAVRLECFYRMLVTKFREKLEAISPITTRNKRLIEIYTFLAKRYRNLYLGLSERRPLISIPVYQQSEEDKSQENSYDAIDISDFLDQVEQSRCQEDGANCFEETEQSQNQEGDVSYVEEVERYRNEEDTSNQCSLEM